MLEGDGTCAALQPLSTRDGADRLRLGLIGDLAAERELPEGLRGGQWAPKMLSRTRIAKSSFQ